MFRFLLGFVYVLYIFIKSSKSSSVLASFNESCSEHISCAYPLICSNTSKCICSKSSSIWNNDQTDCLYCPPGWIEWENNHCLSLAVPSEGGLPYEQANKTCLSVSAQLFYLHSIDQFEQFESKVKTLLQSTFTSAVTIFFRLGAWIDKFNINRFEDIWCDDNEIDPTFQCVFIRKKNFKNDSLCLSRLKCDEEMPFICDMAAISEKNTIENENAASSGQRFADILSAVAPLAYNILGGLLGVNNQPQQTVTQPAAPQQIIIQQDPAIAAHAASSDNTVLLVGLGIGAFLLLLLICGALGAIIHFTGCLKSSSSNEQTNQRSSIESSSSSA